MCYIAFISHSLHWRYIKIALRNYVIKLRYSTILTQRRGMEALELVIQSFGRDAKSEQ